MRYPYKAVMVTLAVLAGVLVLQVVLALLPDERVEPCVIPGQARTTVVECER